MFQIRFQLYSRVSMIRLRIQVTTMCCLLTKLIILAGNISESIFYFSVQRLRYVYSSSKWD